MKILLLTGEQKRSHITKDIEGSLRTFLHEAITFPESLCAIVAKKCKMFWDHGANRMPGLYSVWQLRVVTCLIQNVTTTP